MNPARHEALGTGAPPRVGTDSGQGKRLRWRDPLVTLGDLLQVLAGLDGPARLGALFHEDPLRISERAEAWLIDRCLLLDTRTLALRAITAAASDLTRGREGDGLEVWLGEIFERAARVLVAADQDLAHSDQPIVEPLEPRYLFLTATLGMEPMNVPRACVAINALPEDQRRAFHNLLVQRKGLARYAAQEGLNGAQVKALVTRALRSVSRQAQEPEDSDA